MLTWPGMRAMKAHYWRTPSMVADGDDSIVFLLNNSGKIALSQRGTEASIGTGAALGVLHAEPSKLWTAYVDYVAFGIPRAALVPLVGDVEDAAMKLIPADNEALWLLSRYVQLLRAQQAAMSPVLRHTAVAHAHDLIALALGTTRDGDAEVAFGRGMRAAISPTSTAASAAASAQAHRTFATPFGAAMREPAMLVSKDCYSLPRRMR